MNIINDKEKELQDYKNLMRGIIQNLETFLTAWEMALTPSQAQRVLERMERLLEEAKLKLEIE